VRTESSPDEKFLVVKLSDDVNYLLIWIILALTELCTIFLAELFD